MLAFLLGGPLADRFGYRIPLVFGFLCELGGLVAVSQAPGFSVLMLAGFAVGLGTGLWEVMLPTRSKTEDAYREGEVS